MPGIRDHEPVVIEEFNGWWKRGDDESCPLDHFIQADNVQYGHSSVMTRDPLDFYQKNVTPLKKITRIYNYVLQTGQSLLVLVEGGKIYHIIDPNTMFGPILDIPTMEDFGFVAYNGRAYITPFKNYVNTLGKNVQLGLKGNFLYVYKGDGTQARKAAGFPPKNGIIGQPDSPKKPFIAHNTTTDGKIFAGIHVFAVAFNGGQLGPLPIFPVVDAPGGKQVQLENIPIGPAGTTSRTVVGTQAIPHDKYKDADQPTYTYYVVEVINDNTTTNKIVDIADDDASGTHPIYTPGAGSPPPDDGGLTVRQSPTDGFCDFGYHLVAVVYETDTGYLTAPGPERFGACTYTDVKKAVKVTHIPVSPDTFVKKRHLVSTKWIPEYNGDQKGYQFFFIPEGELDNNTATEKEVSYYDSDLLEDASYLIDNYNEIPAGVSLTTYHGRLILVGESSYPKKADGVTDDLAQPDNRSVARVSAPGEPESIDQVEGLIIAPLDGNALTNCQEMRDVLYLFKDTRTMAYVDNEDVPSSWLPEKVDEGIGAAVHGIGTVLDTGGVNVDYLLIVDWSGLMLFNGTYARPELSWKIENFWLGLNRNDFRYMQIVNDSISKKLWITLPPPYRHMMLFLDYGNGLDPLKVKYARWIFDAQISACALIETNKLMLGAVANAVIP